MNSTAHVMDDNFKKSSPDKNENKVRGLYTIYNMNSTARLTDNNVKISGPDKKENKVKGLYNIYNMNSTTQIITSKNQVQTKKKIRLEDCLLYIIWTRQRG